MLKRKLWSSEEDTALQDLIKEQSDTPQWDILASKMAELGFVKTAKQCKDRWVNNLAPCLDKSKWSVEESKQLFELYLQFGNKWKAISKHFKGRTDNAVKNQFFSVVRKALRTMNKFLGISCNTGMINSIRPKILAELLSPKVVNEFRSKLVQKFAFTSYSVLIKEVTDEEKEAVTGCIKFVTSRNELYLTQKQKRKSKIKKACKSITTDRSSQFNRSVMNLEVAPAKEPSVQNNNSLEIKETPHLAQETNKDTIKNKSKEIEPQINELYDLAESLKNSNCGNQKAMKENFIGFLTKLTSLSLEIKNLLEHASGDQETQNLTEYLHLACSLMQLFTTETKEVKEKCILTDSVGDEMEGNVLGSIYNFMPYVEVEAIGNPTKTALMSKNHVNSFSLNQYDLMDSRKHNTISTTEKTSPQANTREPVCFYNAEDNNSYKFTDNYRMDRKISSEAFDELLAEFNESDSYL